MTGNFAQDVRSLMQTPTYLESSQEDRDRLVGMLRDEFIERSPDASQFFNSEAENAQVEFLRSTGQGRRINNNLQYEAPWQSSDWEFMGDEEKEESIEAFRSSIPTIAKQDRLNASDNEFYLNSVADAQLRKARGEDTGWVADKAYRAFDGFAAGLASYVGAEDTAQAIRNFSAENPKYDDDFMATLFQGAGDMAASTTIFLGATLGGTAATGNPIAGAYVGGAATFATNSIARYNEAYRTAIEQGLGEEQASDAGIAAIPGAAVDAIGDKLIAGKFLPNNYTKAFKTATNAQKRELIAELVRDRSKAGILMNTAKSAFTEGFTEAAGDYAAGYGAFLATGETDFVPTNAELMDSFLIGAVLGGGVTGAVDSVKSFTTDKELLNKTEEEVNRLTTEVPSDEEAAKKVWQLLDEGKYKEGYELSQTIETTPTQEVAQEEEININSEEQAASFLPKNEQEDAIQLPGKKVAEQVTRLIPEEEQATNKLKGAPKELQENFEREVRNQFSIYAGQPNELGTELRSKPVGETSFPVRGIRFGVSETTQGLGTESDEFARDISARVNNIRLVPPGSGTPSTRTADFSLRERTAPEGDTAVQPSPELQTKVDEAIAMGRQNDILSIKPVNSIDEKRINGEGNQKILINSDTALDKFSSPQGQIKGDAFASYVNNEINNALKEGKKVTLIADGGRKKVKIVSVINGMMADEKGQRWGTFPMLSSPKEGVEIEGGTLVPRMNINFPTVDFDVEDQPGETMSYVQAPESMDAMVKQLDARFGKDNWVVKDSQGAASEGIYVGEKMLRDAFNSSDDGLLLNGLYAESYNDNLARRQPGGDQRVHIIKRGGQLEVVPYATHNRNHSLPYISRTDSVRGIEEAALNYARTADAAIPEGGMMGVDVVITADGSLLATELNPTQYGTTAEYYGTGGASGFAGTPYIQSAIYSHLKGRVPAFALAGRQILREEFTKQALDQGAPRIATQIQRMVGNARDAAALKQQLLQNYGERFSDYSEQLWDAFVESAGQITQKIIDLIQRIIDMVRFIPVNGNVSAVNQPMMNQAKTNTALVMNVARQKIKNNSLPSGNQRVGIVFEGQEVNNASNLIQFLEEGSLIRRIAESEGAAGYLTGIPVIRSRQTYFDGNVISFGISDNPREAIAHEMVHAMLDNLIDSNPEFKSQIDSIVGELTQQAEGSVSEFLNKAKDEYSRSEYSRNGLTLSQYIADNLNTIKKGININSDGILDAYAISGPHEFLAASLSSKNFQNQLSSKKSVDNRTLLQKFIDAVKSLFGFVVPEQNILQQVEGIIINYTGENFTPQSIVERGRSYSIKQKSVRKKRLEQLKDLKQHNLDDRFDSNTTSLLAAVGKLKVSHIDMLPPDLKDRTYELIENIWKARKAKIDDPQARINTASLLDELDILQVVIESTVIEKRIKDLDGIYNLKGFDVENGTLAEFEDYLNEIQKKDEAFQEKKKNRNAKAKETYNKKMVAWRQSFSDIRNQIRDRWQSAEQYLQDYETDNGQPIKSKKLREFMSMHFDYLTTLADVSAMEGKQLYRHFFAINNMLDGSLMYGADTTAAYIQQLRDGQININSLEAKFRDPVINQGRGFFGGLDAAQRATEIAQTQLSRWSAFTEAKDFLQKDLMGPFLETIMIEAKNMESDTLRRYDTVKKAFEKAVDREMNGEDRVVMSLASRLIQFASGKDGNKEFQKNLRNEWKNIYNIVGDPTDPKKAQGSGTAAQQSDYQRVVIPTLERLVEGLADSPNPMEQFVININSRMGLGDDAVGKARADLLNSMQSLMSEYTLDTKIISEAFYNKPFTQYVNYLPRLVIPINPEQYNARNGEISDEVEKFDQNYYQAAGLESEPGQIQERNGIGNKGHYSQNIEYIFSRGIHVATLTSATTSERHILNKRLKGGVIRDMINGSNSTYRVDQLQQWARQVMAHAMHSGQPLGTIGVVMKAINESFARVSLSGLHQGVTQTISGFTDYHFRTGNIIGAMQASSFYIQKKEAMDAFFQNNAAWIGERSFLGEQELDRRRNVSFDEKKLANHPAMKFLSKFHDKAGEIITYSLRKGDDFTARSLVLAEYTRLLKQKNPTISSISDVDFSVPEGQILSEAILNVEQNINASNKATRGEFFVDRNRGMAFVRNITVAFSSHVMMLAGQFNIAIRDLVDLHNTGGSKADKARAIRTIGAILGQTLSFSTSRHILNGAMAAGMVSLLRDLFDDEEGKIAKLNERLQFAKDTGNDVMAAHLEDELKAATIIRKQIDKFSQRQTGFNSYFKNAVKDELGAMHFMFNGPQLPQKLIFPVFDNFGEMMMKEDQEARVNRIKEKIAKLKKAKQYGQAARLSEELILIENAEYLPWNIDQFGSIGLGGITGTSLNAIYASLKEFNDAAYGLNEVNLNDFILSAQSAGIGQADILRFTKTVDKIEDEMFRADAETEKRRVQMREKKAREKLERADTTENDAVLRDILNN